MKKNNSSKSDIKFIEVLKHCLSAGSAGIFTMIHAFDFILIILNGGIMKSALMILPDLREKIPEEKGIRLKPDSLIWPLSTESI